MLLDEPSNHLDIATTEWLESYLARQPVAMVVVSHDRYFLDKVVNKVWEMHFGRITVYPGNYTQYWRLRAEKAKVLERQAERQEGKAAELEAYIRKYGAGQRAKQAHDRERKLERLERERVDTLRDVVGPVMGFDEVERSGDIVIEARRLSKSYDVPLFRDLSLTVEPGRMRRGDRAQRRRQDHAHQDLDRPRETRPAATSKLGHKVQIGYHDQGLRSLDARHHGGPRRLARRRPRLGRERRPRSARTFRIERRPRISNRGPALRRREGQGRPRPALRHFGQRAGHGRADQPPRHLVSRSARAIDQRIRGNRARREPRPVFSQSGRGPPGRNLRRPGPPDRGRLRHVPAHDRARKGTRREPRGRTGRRWPDAAQQPRTAAGREKTQAKVLLPQSRRNRT